MNSKLIIGNEKNYEVKIDKGIGKTSLNGSEDLYDNTYDSVKLFMRDFYEYREF